MEVPAMHLKVILPHQIFWQQEGVKRIVVETRQGSLGLLPRRLDCVADLVPGILTYETDPAGESYLAVDAGMLVKCGFEVLVSVRNAIAGDELENLRQAVEAQFMKLNEQEKSVRMALAGLENSFIRRFMELKRYGSE
ncbi:MAG TPA: F0F1 ATP synthase subunit epsilon [Methylomusa anaerophila]|uniref:ATP synthase epsilon chain n=1 Tax=Methylomusa anaerophila TaxID=1930071 RepID=A0A348ALB4_9FIRM|nr:F0F1 ATP synthase subunit epsilon [Methylomusa anaerophila]BBB91862.1 F0F1 ATP synthase subunit epsilon [Methylomusa anaerophila]HML88407.1 F0F1 ATP synthase subunit epsilon [Methylomusa anaerophila]